MKEHFVIDPLISKRQQLLLATQLCRMVLKVRIVFRFVFVACRLLQRVLLLSLPSVSPPSASSSLAVLFSRSVSWQSRGSGEVIHGSHTRKSASHVTRGKHPFACRVCDTDSPFPRPDYKQQPCMPFFAPCISARHFTRMLMTFCRSTMLSLLETTSRISRRHCRSQGTDKREASLHKSWVLDVVVAQLKRYGQCYESCIPHRQRNQK